MSGAPQIPLPQDIKRHARESIEVRWSDGHVSLFPNRYLRDNCPCAGCREERGGRRSLPVRDLEEIYPIQISAVGRYAVSIEWSDHHDSGIYRYETLRHLCPCDRCQRVMPQHA